MGLEPTLRRWALKLRPNDLLGLERYTSSALQSSRQFGFIPSCSRLGLLPITTCVHWVLPKFSFGIFPRPTIGNDFLSPPDGLPRGNTFPYQLGGFSINFLVKISHRLLKRCFHVGYSIEYLSFIKPSLPSNTFSTPSSSMTNLKTALAC